MLDRSHFCIGFLLHSYPALLKSVKTDTKGTVTVVSVLTFFYIPVGLSPEEFERAYDRGLDRTKHYVGHYNEADINDILDNYFDVEPTALAYDEISYDTPCGFYIQA